MEFYQLKCFYEVARLENVSKAAETLHVSQPALSICIRKLEEELGCELLVRNGRSIRLGVRGKAIIPYIEKIMSYQKEIMNTCQGKFESEELFIEARAAIPIVIDVVSHFHQDYPNIKIHMTNEENRDEVPDLIIGASCDAVLKSNIQAVYREQIVIAIPRILVQSYDIPVSYDFIRENTLIGISKNYSFNKIEEHYLNYNHLGLKHSIVCDSPAMLRNLLNNGTGIAFVPSKTWLLQRNPALKLVCFEGQDWSLDITIEQTFFRDNSDIVSLFISDLTNKLQSL